MTNPATQRHALPPLDVTARDLPPAVLTDLSELALKVELPVQGWGWSDPDAAWWRLVGQIAAVGSSRSWAALDRQSTREELSVHAIRGLGHRAVPETHRILAAAGVRYCSPQLASSTKAKAIAQNAASEWVADEDGSVRILDRLLTEVGSPVTGGYFSSDQSRLARQVLVRQLNFFGPKSASDFLLGLGLTDSLIAFDVRVLNLLTECLGWSPACRHMVGSMRGYSELEDQASRLLAAPAGLSLLAVDRVMFQRYQDLRVRWSPIGRGCV